MSTAQFQDYARAALVQYGLDPDTEVSLLNISENGTFKIVDEHGMPSVLRVHRTQYHSRAAIASELAWVTALRTEGVVNTPPFLPTTSGESIATVHLPDGSSRYVVRFAWVEGAEPSEARLVEDFSELGAITARLHAHARTWQVPAGFTRFTWDYDTSLGDHGHWGSWRDGFGIGPAELDILGRCAARIKERLDLWGTSAERFGLIHADMRLANLLVAGSQVTVIDFDDCGLGWFLYDLGSSLSFIEHEPYVPELVDSWVNGYRSVAPLDSQDIAELPTFVMLRRLLLVSWIGDHASTELAQSLGPQYTVDSCRLAEEYLSGTYLS